MAKNYTSSKHLMGIQEFMQNFLQKMGNSNTNQNIM